MKTSKDRSFFPKMVGFDTVRHLFTGNSFEEDKASVGSGILLGIYGRHGHEIDSLGFTMLRKILAVDMTNVAYDMTGSLMLAPRLVSCLDVTLANASKNSTDQGYKRIMKQRSDSGSWGIPYGEGGNP